MKKIYISYEITILQRMKIFLISRPYSCNKAHLPAHKLHVIDTHIRGGR